MNKVGRNDPCPCGSGQKYKKCCLRLEEARSSSRHPHPVHALDNELVHRMFRFGDQCWGPQWRDEAAEEYSREDEEFSDEETGLVMQWSLYHYVHGIDGERLIDRFLAERPGRLSTAEIDWLTAQKAAWFSVWEVADLDRAACVVTLRDLLTGQERRVHDVGLSDSLQPRLCVLCRVVTIDDELSVAAGAHPRPLPPMSAQRVIERTRATLEAPRRKIRSRELQDPQLILELLDFWRDEEDALLHPSLPRLTNTDGEPLCWTVQTFVFPQAERPALLERLRDQPQCKELDQKADVSHFNFFKPGNRASAGMSSTSLANAHVFADRLELETNSKERAHRFRQILEAACGSIIRYEGCEEKDIREALLDPDQEPAPTHAAEQEALMQSPEVQALIREHKRKHYEGWLDMSIPALDNLTPRQAAAMPTKRPKLVALLNEMEFRENQLPPQQRFDVNTLRSALEVKLIIGGA